MPRKSTPARAAERSGSPPARSIDPLRLIALIPFRPHETIGDIGCGVGDLTIPLAKYVFDGKVYAVDVDADSLERAAERAR